MAELNRLQQWGELVRLSIKTRVGYRFDFIVGSLGTILSNLINLGVLLILTLQYQTLMGWSFWELVFFYNLWLFGHGFYSTFFRNVENLQTLVVSGDFDRFLLKPADPLIQLIGSQFYFYGAGDWIISGTMLVLSYLNLGLSWGLAQVGFFMLSIVSAFVLETAISLLLASLSFWLGKTDGLNWLVFQFNYSLTQKYPIDLFQIPFQLLLTLVAPFAFMNFFPGVWLLGRLDTKALWDLPWLHFLGPLVAILFSFVALLVWKKGLAAYKSSGS